jgi:hypothetical protein
MEVTVEAEIEVVRLGHIRIIRIEPRQDEQPTTSTVIDDE